MLDPTAILEETEEALQGAPVGLSLTQALKSEELRIAKVRDSPLSPPLPREGDAR